MRTVILSDLHLGSRSSIDLLRRAEVRDALAPTLAAADRVILLGDTLELRDRPLPEVLDLARPVLASIGDAVGDGELVLVAGNHDHHLVAPWIERQALDGEDPLGLEREIEIADGPLSALADAVGRNRLRVRYPGLWVRGDVYATHGHYLDRHLTIPTIERLAHAVVERVLGITAEPAGAATAHRGEALGVREYERVQTPVNELLFGLAQGGRHGPGPGAGASFRVWRALTAKGTPAARLRGWLLGAIALRGGVGIANRLGLGPVSPDLSPAAITQAGLAAMAAVIEELDIDAEHVVFGHTHRRGPMPGDSGWQAAGTRLWNTGSWVFAPSLIGSRAARSPYWPGTVVVVEDDGAPRLEHVLDDRSGDELADAAGRGADA